MLAFILSLLVFVTLIVSVCVKQRKWSLIIQAVSCLLSSAYDFLITAYTGAIVELVNFCRSILFAGKRRFSRRFYAWLLAVFELFILANCYWTWAGIISLLPTIASIIRTYCLWQDDMKLIRLSGAITGILLGLYYLYYHSTLLVIGYAVLAVVSLVRMGQLDRHSC